MELFRLEMRKKFGVVVNYNYDKTGVPNGFIVIDPQSKSVWKGEELGGFNRASPPYLSQGVFVMNVESIGGRAPRYAVRELDKNDVAAYKNGEMLLEELVLKFNSKAMDKKCSNLDTPLWQLSTGEFLQLLKDCLNEKSPKNNNTVATKVEEHWVYGIDGIAKIFNCSRGTAMNIKKSGVINPAIKQVGRKIVVDVQLALELAGKKGGRNG